MPNLFASIVAILVLALGAHWPAPGQVPGEATLAWLVVLPLLSGGFSRVWVRRHRRHLATHGQGFVRHQLLRGRLLVVTGTLFGFAVAVFAGGWAQMALSWTPAQVPILAQLLGLFPYLLAALVGVTVISRGECSLSDLASDAPHSGNLADTLGRELRPLALPLVPFLLFSGVLDLSWYYPEIEIHLVTHPLLAAGVLVMTLLLVLTLSPFVVRFLFPSRSLPPGPTRDRFESLSRRAGVGLRDIRVWDTGGRNIINACIAGPFRPVRYVFFTDGILNHLSLRELEAVFAHELGHARHHHFLIFFSVIVAFMFGLQWADAFLELEEFTFLGLLLVAAVLYFRGGFGVLSRQLESQADIYSAELIASAPDTAQALERVGQLTGGLQAKRGWRHHPLPRRIEILARFAGDGGFRTAFRRRTRTYLILVGITFTLSSIGWLATLRAEAARPPGWNAFYGGSILLDDFRRNSQRPIRDPEREEQVLRRAENHLLTAYKNAPRELEHEILVQLTAVYEGLGEEWNAAATRILAGLTPAAPAEMDPTP